MILFRLLALPITAPAAGIKYCIERVVDYAEQQLTEDGPVREELLELALALEEGRVSEDAFAEREAVLLARLREIREYRKDRAATATPAEGEERHVVIEVPEELK